jgi:hypothetical protein
MIEQMGYHEMDLRDLGGQDLAVVVEVDLGFVRAYQEDEIRGKEGKQRK